MAIVVFKGWTKGMRGIAFMFLLKDKAGVSLKIAQGIKTKVLDNETIKLEINDSETAKEIVLEAQKLGVNSEWVE